LNEHDYYIFSITSLFIGVIYLLMGSFLLIYIDLFNYVNIFLIMFVFILFFSISIYFNYKKRKYEREMLKELKKYVDEVHNNGVNSS
jgi:hypothetical protein